MLEQPQLPASSARRSPTRWIALAIVGVFALVGCAGLVVALLLTIIVPQLRSSTSQPVVSTTGAAVPTPVKVDPTAAARVIPQQPANSLGNPDAPVKIVEYADFQCPYCMQFWKETEPQIIEQYVKTGKVYYEYRSVGAFLGPESGAAAQAAYCAGDQGKFWQYHDTLFSNWTGENVGDFTNDKLQGYAASLGLDEATFSDCLGSGKYAALLKQDVKDAKAGGIQATPSFLINGKLLEGALPFASFQEVIDAALQGK